MCAGIPFTFIREKEDMTIKRILLAICASLALITAGYGLRGNLGQGSVLPNVQAQEPGRKCSVKTLKGAFEQIIGNSPAMREMLSIAHKVAESEVSSVLLQGPSGTGKDLVAKAIHYQSHRGDGPFVELRGTSHSM